MPTEQFAIPVCRHLKTNGLRCQSPALKNEPFCYFHTRLHKHHPAPLTARETVNARNLQYEGYEEALIGAGEDPMLIARAYPNQNEFHFPPLEDAESIQLAASMLFHAICHGQIHLRRARLLRDILRVASTTCARVKSSPEAAQQVVREIDHTPDGLTVAPADQASAQPPSPESLEPNAAVTEPAEPAAQQPAVDSLTSDSGTAEPDEQPAPDSLTAEAVAAAQADEHAAPESPSTPIPQLTPNQDFGANPFQCKILPELRDASTANSRFCDFFDARHPLTSDLPRPSQPYRAASY